MTVSSATTGTSSTTSSSSSSSTSIDWSALIDAAVNAKLTQATSISTSITANQAKVSAYQVLQTDLKTLASGLTSLSSSIINSCRARYYK